MRLLSGKIAEREQKEQQESHICCSPTSPVTVMTAMGTSNQEYHEEVGQLEAEGTILVIFWRQKITILVLHIVDTQEILKTDCLTSLMCLKIKRNWVSSVIMLLIWKKACDKIN